MEDFLNVTRTCPRKPVACGDLGNGEKEGRNMPAERLGGARAGSREALAQAPAALTGGERGLGETGVFWKAKGEELKVA